jgi:hypothetical protein
MLANSLRRGHFWFHKGDYANPECNRNIEMTPLCKAQTALSRMLGLREDGPDVGGVNEQQGVRQA